MTKTLLKSVGDGSLGSECEGERSCNVGLTRIRYVEGEMLSGESVVSRDELGVWPVHGIYVEFRVSFLSLGVYPR